jgi:hypothetical protein
MRRISTVWKGARKESTVQSPFSPRPPPEKDAGIRPPPTDSWVVNEQFLEESSLLIPASPDDVDDVTRQVFVSRAFAKTNEWVDFDVVMYELGSALDIFPNNSTFDSLKWVFVRATLFFLFEYFLMSLTRALTCSGLRMP